MALRLLVNTGLLAIPIGGSIGTLLGIDAHRSATGQAPLFTSGGSNTSTGGDSTGGGSRSSGSATKNSVYCETSWGISPPSDGLLYTLNPNQWGVTDSSSGALCMNFATNGKVRAKITTFKNETYSTKTTAPEFSVTWQYDPGPETAPVHAYPNIMVDDVLPVELGNMSQVNIDVHWTYGVGNTAASSTDISALTAEDLQTNVAIDMFFDTDKAIAQNSTQAKYEVMVWFLEFGASAQPIGLNDGVVTTRTLNGVLFKLYTGTKTVTGNPTQNVLSWVASEPQETFTGDIYPLITDLYTLTGDVYPSASDYMGIFQFGSEAFSVNNNVTFSVPKLSIDIQT
ncbi:uncharacterized protein N7482_004456 [Penicillium canariense]|uniref:xyloglucan-specific endo-beta-1,4-glucanase n=1 Tax=Penicillium canariense TaxID=189055 RepID=A0A9W9IAE6_9EURO|nr:uncharacterized protein N7482_004456 [Penicillium canariense]KAJ5168862.1 hypothetical protein N7482_004456 [Penicillium canariense]